MNVIEASLRAPAPAKLNLFLHVVGQRADGYHLLQTAFTLVDWQDELIFERRQDGQIHRLSNIEGVAAEEDLVVRAARLLQKHTGTSFGATIHVDKHLPSGAGLGGGSSDAATTLMALNYLWGTGLDDGELAALGVQLGADVPVFIFGQDAFAQGIGEQLQAIELKPQAYVLIQPDLEIPTPVIFKAPQLKRDTPVQDYASVVQGLHNVQACLEDVETDKLCVNIEQVAEEGECAQVGERTVVCKSNSLYYGQNDLEAVALALYPSLKSLVDALHQQGWPVRMTGSGSCFFLPVATREQAQAVATQIRDWAMIWQKSSSNNLVIKHVQACNSVKQHPIKALI